MESKKNEDKRVERRMPFHFLIGLNVALALVLLAFEWRTEEAPIIVDDYFVKGAEWDSLISLPPPPPPPVPKPPKKVTVVEVIDEPDEPDEPTIIDTEAPQHVEDLNLHRFQRK